MTASMIEITTTSELANAVESVLAASGQSDLAADETYAETAERVRQAGMDDLADFMEAAEGRWNEIEN